MEIIQERLEREFNQTVITTVPNVSFIAYTTRGEKIIVNNPSEMPDPVKIEHIEEPYIRAQIITAPDYIGNIITLCLSKRGILLNQSYLTPTRVELIFEMPMTEIVFDFYDKLKSQTRGYASFDYSQIGFRDADIVKMDILLNAEKVDALLQPVKLEKVNTAESRENLGEKIGGLIAYILIPLCLAGCSYPAIDIGAGEKERGTLETLLICPISRTSIVLGKFLTELTTGLASALNNVTSYGGWGYVIGSLMGVDIVAKTMSTLGVADLLLILMMLIPLSAIFASLLLSLSERSESMRSRWCPASQAAQDAAESTDGPPTRAHGL